MHVEVGACRFDFPNVPFCILKRHVRKIKTAHFAILTVNALVSTIYKCIFRALVCRLFSYITTSGRFKENRKSSLVEIPYCLFIDSNNSKQLLIGIENKLIKVNIITSHLNLDVRLIV